jgi:hypothetical protein
VNLSNSAPMTATLTLTADGTVASAIAKATLKKKNAMPIVFENGWWRAGGIGAGLMLSVLLAFPYLRQRRFALATVVASCTILIVAIGCGGGSSGSTSSGGPSGGGGVVGQASTTTTVTLPSAKVPQGQPVTATATVKSTAAVTGTVTFWTASTNGAITPPVPLVNGSATSTLSVPQAGVYQVYATYDGDSANKASQSPIVVLGVTGTQLAGISATTGPLSHRITFPVTLQ